MYSHVFWFKKWGLVELKCVGFVCGLFCSSPALLGYVG
jgi:hypothetical protein